MSTVMNTSAGLRIDLLDPHPAAISIVDIAHHLSNLCRFTGATRTHYSVAQHSVLVAAIVEQDGPVPRHRAEVLAALLHDAHEAYTGDIGTPMKEALGRDRVRGVEAGVQEAIMRRYVPVAPTSPKLGEAIRRADLVALATERRDLMPPDESAIWPPEMRTLDPHPDPIVPLPASEAETLFLDTFRRLVS